MSVRAHLDAIEEAHGERPHTCPWYPFHEPDVRAVIQAYDFFESGQLSEWWGADPEWWLVEAVRFYHRCVGQARNDVDKIKRGKGSGLSTPRPPIGQVVHRQKL